MNTTALIAALDTILDIHSCDAIDRALNGVQVGRHGADIDVVATAVDACIESIERAAELGAGMLFVHHGIFWGGQEPLIGSRRRRIELLLQHDIALYAAHLPLDMHATLGNNVAIAEHLGLTDIQPFGKYKGAHIGYCGTLQRAMQVDDIAGRLYPGGSEGMGILRFGESECRRVAIVSGGGNMLLDEAIHDGFDLFITGDRGYANYYRAYEEGINVIFGGHYNTEVWGVQRVGEYVRTTYNIEATFIDLPTGL